MRDLTLIGQTVGTLLKDKKHTIAVAESSAGGLISAALLSVPGASAYFLGAGVIYTHEARRALLGLPDDALTGVRPSTEEYARRLARAIRERFQATWGLCETGATGPTGNSYGDAAGHACISLVGPTTEQSATIETRHGNRELNMWSFAQAALDLLETSLKTST